MILDAYSYTAPSRVRALLVPVGRIKRSKFIQFVERLREVNNVRLGDVSPDPRATRTTFSPLGFPNGQVVYDFVTAYDVEHEYLEGFELYRRIFLVVAIADSTEENSPAQLSRAIKELQFQYPRALLHPLVLCDTPLTSPLYASQSPGRRQDDDEAPAPEYPPLTIPIPSKGESTTTSIRTLICDLTSLLLSKFAGLARSLQALPTIESPFSTTDDQQNGHRMSMPPEPGGSGAKPGITAASGGAVARMSMTAFGSGSLAEKARSKGKGRVGIAIGSLFLLSGRVTDAYKEFVEGATISKLNFDYLWYGKALEGIGISLVIMAYLGLEFQIPTLLLPQIMPVTDRATKPSNTGTSSPPPTAAVPASPATLFSIMPDLLSTILTLYTRSAMTPGEQLPSVVMCETILRVSRLLVTIHQCHGLNPIALKHTVTGIEIPSTLGKGSVVGLSRADIASVVMRAYPTPSDTMSVMDTTRTLGAIASMLDAIGFHRRKALVTRELIRSLIPGLIQARVLGAAEMGLHPAASNGTAMSLSASDLVSGSGDVEYVRTDSMLDDLCRAYGIRRSHDKETQKEEINEWSQIVQSSITEDADLRGFGWMSLKVGVLRSCILFSEALADYEGILRFTTQLLRTAGKELSKGEQGKLAESFTRTVGGARRSGMEEGGEGVAEYWDDCLIVDIDLIESNMWKPPIPHPKHELEQTTQAVLVEKKNPFIYNAFVEKTANKAAMQVVVQGEVAEFLVTMQNPFEFEIQIDSIKLEGAGVEFDCKSIGTVIGPYRKHTAVLSAIPKTAGTLGITGCQVRVYGCREKMFAVIPQAPDHENELKTKDFGLAAARTKSERPVSTISQPSRTAKPPVMKQLVKELVLTVVPLQPLLVTKSTSYSQSAVMVLEGERQIFTMTLHNLSSTPVDLLLFSFVDSTTGPIQAAIGQSQTHPAEVYELELILYKKQAFAWRKPDQEPTIEADGTATFEIEVLGKPGLTNGIIYIDYGHLGKPRSEIEKQFYTRQLVAPITVTVNASIELARMDFLAFGKDFSTITQGPMSIPPHDERFNRLLQTMASLPDPSQYCLVLVDLRNSWPHTLKVTLSCSENPLEFGEIDNKPFFTMSDTIAAGHSTRLIVPLKRIFLANAHGAIPSFSSTPRQYVVSMTKTSPGQERLSRESFWYRNEVLKHIHGDWEEVGTSRKGVVELRNFRLSPRMVETVKIEDVEMVIAVDGQSAESGKFSVPTDEFTVITTTIRNRTSRPLLLLLRLLPSLRNAPAAVALDTIRRFAFNGSLQKPLNLLQPGEEVISQLGCMFLCAGKYEMDGMVEEIKVGDEVVQEKSKQSDARGVEDFVNLVGTERSSWYCKEMCFIVAEDKI